MAEGGLFTTAVNNPGWLSDDELVQSFVAREPLLHRLLDDLRELLSGASPQHQLIVGQRGMGKTTLLRRIGIAIKKEPELAAKWIPLTFPEEQYNVKNLGDFWLNCADALSDALDRAGHKAAAAALDRKVATVTKVPEERSTAGLAILMDEARRLGRGLVLLIDNLDIVLERLDETQEWEFRRVLSDERGLYFFGGSSRALESFYEYGRAFYDYFHVSELKPFSFDEMFSLLTRLAEKGGDEAVQKILKEKQARVRSLGELTGGNPRTLVMLYRVLSQGPDGDVRRDIEQLLDLYTPLYKARFEELPAQAQQVVDTVAIHWYPISAGEVTEKLGTLAVNQVSAQLKRLEDFGVVEKTERYGDKKTAYQIAERFFNVWYLMRASRRERQKLIWLVRFFEGWFEKAELEHYAEAMLRKESVTPYEAETRFAFSQLIDDPILQRGLRSSGLRALEQFRNYDYTGLQPEVIEEKDRRELLRELRERVLSCDLFGVDREEFWRLLGGSPYRTLAEKKRLVVEVLPTLDGDGISNWITGFGIEERMLRRSLGHQSDPIGKLYGALASGEMIDGWDTEGAVAAGRTNSSSWLPIAALMAQILTSSDDVETGALDGSLRKLEQIDGYKWCGAWANGVRLSREGGDPAAGQSFFRIALELEPNNWLVLVSLAELLSSSPERLEEARQTIERSIELNDRCIQAWCVYGDVLKKLGLLQKAEGMYRKALEIDSADDWAWSRLGMLARLNGGYNEAETALRKAVDVQPGIADYWGYLALTQLQLARFEETTDSISRAIEIDPGVPKYWAILGILRVFLGQYREAELAFRNGLKLDSNDLSLLSGMFMALCRMPERCQEATELIFKIAASGAFETYFNERPIAVIRSLAMHGDYIVADVLVPVFEQHERNPDDREVSFLLVELLVLNCEWERAKPILAGLVSSAGDADQPDVRTFGAVAQAGHADEAIAMLENCGADDRWRPLYEALRAYRERTADYLLRVAPEVRGVAEEILQGFDSALVSGRSGNA